jgi:hypothetical protein
MSVIKIITQNIKDINEQVEDKLNKYTSSSLKPFVNFDRWSL